MTLDPEGLRRGSGSALWRQIADSIEVEIADGAYSESDSRLPTEKSLSERFGVNRHTVRRALAALAETGLIRAEQGRGVFVNAEVLEYPLGRRVRFTESLSAHARTPMAAIISAEIAPAPGDVQRALNLAGDATVWKIDRLGSDSDRPLSFASHYVDASRFPRFGEAFANQSSVTRALAEAGVADYERRETRVSARPATAEEARRLDLPRGRPVLVTEGLNVDTDGRPVEFSVARFAADRVQLLA